MTGTVGSRCPGTKGFLSEINTLAAVVESMQNIIPSIIRECEALVEVPFAGAAHSASRVLSTVEAAWH